MFGKALCVRVLAGPRLSVLARSGCGANLAAVVCQRAGLFTNAKKDYTSQKTSAEQSANFFDKEVKGEDDIPSGRNAERQLPSHKQLLDELPSAEEIEEAIRKGNIADYVTEDDHDSSGK